MFPSNRLKTHKNPITPRRNKDKSSCFKSSTDHITLPHLQYGPAVSSVRTEPEVPAMRSVAPPTVVLALGGVLPRYARPLASPWAYSLERPWLLESEPIRHKVRWRYGKELRLKEITCISNLQSVSSISASASLSPWGSDNTHSSCRWMKHMEPTKHTICNQKNAWKTV